MGGIMPREGPIEEWVQQECAARVPRISQGHGYLAAGVESGGGDT